MIAKMEINTHCGISSWVAAGSARRSILRWSLHVIDYQHLHPRGGRLQLEPQLLRQRGKDRWRIVGRGRREETRSALRPQSDLEDTTQTRLVDDGSVSLRQHRQHAKGFDKIRELEPTCMEGAVSRICERGTASAHHEGLHARQITRLSGAVLCRAIQ